MSDFTFSNRHRLHGESRFRDVFRHGKRRSAGPFTLYVHVRAQKPNATPRDTTRSSHAMPRLGLVISRFQGNAVTRNAAKRVMREVFRHVKEELPAADYILRVHRRLDSLPRDAWASALRHVFAAWVLRPAGSSS